LAAARLINTNMLGTLTQINAQISTRIQNTKR
jgi:hypothetical protein